MLHRVGVIVAVLVLVAFYAISCGELAEEAGAKKRQPVHERCTTAAFRSFAEEVWDARWQRGAPAPATIRAKRQRVACAPAAHRRAMIRIWDRERDHYYSVRRTKLWQARVTPYPGDGRLWAIPYYIVACESGGRANSPAAPNGAYSLLTDPLQGVPTWETWRPDWADGHAAPYQAPKRAQDIAAHRLWVAYGSEPWVECA
jgi:hypothetical protein